MKYLIIRGVDTGDSRLYGLFVPIFGRAQIGKLWKTHPKQGDKGGDNEMAYIFPHFMQRYSQTYTLIFTWFSPELSTKNNRSFGPVVFCPEPDPRLNISKYIHRQYFLNRLRQLNARTHPCES